MSSYTRYPKQRNHNSKISKSERQIEEQRHRMRIRGKIMNVAHGLDDQVVIDFTPRLHPSWWW